MVESMKPEHGYFLYVDQEQIHKFFQTRKTAEEEAEPHIQSRAALQIKTTGGAGELVQTWNYRYDVKQWVEMLK